MNSEPFATIVNLEVRSGAFRGQRLGDVFMDEQGSEFLRHYTLTSPDPALATAARHLYELRSDLEPLPPTGLDKELLGLAALTGRKEEP